MSPGPTFERVYLALKEQLGAGRYPPGTHLEPRVLTDELCSSITPIRDALHRLVGERLVEAPRNDGFRVPILTELVLRQLYGWQADLLRLALGRYRSHLQAGNRPVECPAEGASASAAGLFLELGRASHDLELFAALANACDRLAPVGMLEVRFIPDLADELDTFRRLLNAPDPAALRQAITAYQRRRIRVVPQLVAALQRSF